jgi:HK97 gp10 family phage protein
MPEIFMEIKGFRELDNILAGFTDRVQRNIMFAMSLAGAAVLKKAAREKCPIITGKLRKSIVTRRRKSPRGMAIYGVGSKLYYASMVERGTKPHVIKSKSGKILLMAKGHPIYEVHHPGARAKPFLRPAFDENQSRIIEAMRQKGWERINREFAKR